MTISSLVVDRIIARAMRTPYTHIDGYMNRYWLLPYGPQGIAVRVHQILRSDNDRVFHDHPWPYCSIILRGEYTEVRPIFKSGIYVGDTSRRYGAGSVIMRPARSWHRLVLPKGESAWTLFTTGPKVQSWGFLVEPRHKVYWQEYEGQQ